MLQLNLLYVVDFGDLKQRIMHGLFAHARHFGRLPDVGRQNSMTSYISGALGSAFALGVGLSYLLIL